MKDELLPTALKQIARLNRVFNFFEKSVLKSLKLESEKRLLPIALVASLRKLETKPNLHQLIQSANNPIELTKEQLNKIFSQIDPKEFREFIEFDSTGLLKLNISSNAFAETLVKEFGTNAKDLSEFQNVFKFASYFDDNEILELNDFISKNPEATNSIKSFLNQSKDYNFKSAILNRFKWELALAFGMPETLVKTIVSLNNSGYKISQKNIAYLQKVCKKIRKINNDARPDQKVNLKAFVDKFSSLAPILFSISPFAAKHIINSDLEQRANLPIVFNKLETLAHIDQDSLDLLKRVCNKIENSILKNDPYFIFEIFSQHKIFNTEGKMALDFDALEMFEKIISENSNDKEAISSQLGNFALTKFMYDLGADIDLSQITNSANFAKDWDTEFLGTLLSQSHKWSEANKQKFGLIFSAYTNGKLDGILWPPAYKDHPISSFGKFSDLAQKMRRRTLKVLKEMEEIHSIDVAQWLNAANPKYLAHIFPGGSQINSKGLRKELVLNLSRDFKSFEDWFPVFKDIANSNITITKICNRQGLGEEAIQSYQRRFAKAFNRFKAQINQWTSNKPKIDKLFTKDEVSKLLESWKLFKEPLLEFIVENLQEGELVPEQILDFDNSIETIYNNIHNPEKFKKRDLRIRLMDPRDIGHTLFTGNRANSCTAIGDRNATVIPLATDIAGTKYFVIEKPASEEKLDQPRGQILGYLRIFLGLDEQGAPTIAYDSIDGSKAGQERQKMFEAARLFAKTLKPGQMTGSKTRSNLGNGGVYRDPQVKEKLGGLPSKDYKNHFALGKQPVTPLPITEDELFKLDNWQPQNGWYGELKDEPSS